MVVLVQAYACPLSTAYCLQPEAQKHCLVLFNVVLLAVAMSVSAVPPQEISSPFVVSSFLKQEQATGLDDEQSVADDPPHKAPTVSPKQAVGNFGSQLGGFHQSALKILDLELSGKPFGVVAEDEAKRTIKLTTNQAKNTIAKPDTVPIKIFLPNSIRLSTPAEKINNIPPKINIRSDKALKIAPIMLAAFVKISVIWQISQPVGPWQAAGTKENQ